MECVKRPLVIMGEAGYWQAIVRCQLKLHKYREYYMLHVCYMSVLVQVQKRVSLMNHSRN